MWRSSRIERKGFRRLSEIYFDLWNRSYNFSEAVPGKRALTEDGRVKDWPWSKIIPGIGCALVLLGVAPIGYLFWWSFSHNLRPLSMPLPLKRGEYSSPFFKTDLDDSYQVDVTWNGSVRQHLAIDFDWRVVDDRGIVLKQGILNYHEGGNTVSLGQYRPKRGLRQHIVIRNFEDVQGMETAHPILEVGLPERTLGMSYAAAYAIKLARNVAGPGLLWLLFVFVWRAIRRARRPRQSPNPHQEG